MIRILIAALCFVMGSTGPAFAAEKKAVFAGGCFWCMEPPFDKLEGVTKTLSGFAGGTIENPTYKQVSAGGTGHIEVIEVTYDPDKVSYKKLLEVYWANVDPLDDGGQFCDRGHAYKTAIFYADEEDQALAVRSKDAVESGLKDKVATFILPLDTFYPAEDYHQDYYLKNPTKYKFYRWRCGRDARLDDVWGDSARKGIRLELN